MKIDRVQAYRLSIPFREETVVPFTVHRIMESVVLRVFAGDQVGISETTGNPGFSGESANGILAALQYLVPRVLGADPRAFRSLHRLMDSVVGNPAAKAGIDIACFDLAAKAFGVPVAMLLGGVAHERIMTQHLLPLKPVEEIARDAKIFSAAGYRIFEVKITYRKTKIYHFKSVILKTGPSVHVQIFPLTVLTIQQRQIPNPHAIRFSRDTSQAMPFLVQ